MLKKEKIMKTLLNEQGKELVLVKERISNKEIPNDIVSIILSKYPKEIQTIYLQIALLKN